MREAASGKESKPGASGTCGPGVREWRGNRGGFLRACGFAGMAGCS
jgi:hypothetical protein